MGRYRKAIAAFLTGVAGPLLAAVASDGGVTWQAGVTAAVVGVLALAGTTAIPNKGYLDLSSLTPAQRDQLAKILNLDD